MKIEHIVRYVKANKVSFATALITHYKWPVFFAIEVTNILSNPDCLKRLHTYYWRYLTNLFLTVQNNVKRDPGTN